MPRSVGWFAGRLSPYQCSNWGISTRSARRRCRLHVVPGRYPRNFFRAMGLFRVTTGFRVFGSDSDAAPRRRKGGRKTRRYLPDSDRRGPVSSGALHRSRVVRKIRCGILFHAKRYHGAVSHRQCRDQHDEWQNSAPGFLASKHRTGRDDTKGASLLEASRFTESKAIPLFCRIRIGFVWTGFGFAGATRGIESGRNHRWSIE
mmetsp:Transcript_11132/g.22066  ORF Transcript_11132/g.22066 Transcript_11132/m.22066 type:complete len:203 (-) Transcript_11132:93-701(-)